MHNVIFMQVQDPRNNLLHNLGNFSLGECFLCLDTVKQITTLTQFHDENILILPLEYLK